MHNRLIACKKCVVMAGQVGAVRLGISRALQCWEPDLRPALRSGIATKPYMGCFIILLYVCQHILYKD